MTIATIGRRMKKLGHGYSAPRRLAPAWAAAGLRRPRSIGTVSASTFMPGRTFCSPSTMTRSPALRPDVDHPQRADALGRRDHALLDLVVRAERPRR